MKVKISTDDWYLGKDATRKESFLLEVEKEVGDLDVEVATVYLSLRKILRKEIYGKEE